MQQLSTDQSRLRENLKIIPQTSEPYKKFLEKFVAQESAIEAYQKQIRESQTAVQQQTREIDVVFGPVPPPTGIAPASYPAPGYPTTPGNYAR